MELKSVILEVAATSHSEFKGDVYSKEFALYVQDRLARIAREKYPDVFVDCILFGSKARGDFNRDSDIDLCFVLNCSEEQINKEEEYKYFLFDDRYSMEFDIGFEVSIDCYCMTEEQYKSPKRWVDQEIVKDGISWKNTRM